MENKNWKLLQLFAEGGDGGAEGAGQTGESAAAAGQQVREAESAPTKTQRAEEKGQAAAAAPRLTWEQIKADPEYRAQMQAMVQSRLKNVKQAQEDLAALTPALQLLARENGLLITGGSDCHESHLGEYLTDDETVAKILALSAYKGKF